MLAAVEGVDRTLATQRALLLAGELIWYSWDDGDGVTGTGLAMVRQATGAVPLVGA